MNGYRVSFSFVPSELFEYEFISVTKEGVINEFDRMAGEFIRMGCLL